MTAVANDPIMRRYHPTDQPEVFEFLRASFSAEESARIIGQWAWKYESNPFNPPEGPIVFVTRQGTKVVSIVAGFRLPAWIAGSLCQVENLGTWVVHPDYRRQGIWWRVDNRQVYQAPIAIAWGRRLSAHIGTKGGWVPSQMNAMLRILDPGQMIEHFSGSRVLASLGAAAHTATRVITYRFRHSPFRNDTAVRLGGVDERCDSLWEHCRSDDRAMVIRNSRYLQWRYMDRPDAEYLLFGVGHGSELLGILVARSTTRNSMRWGYLVDFLIANKNAEGVFALLIQAALDEFRRRGAAAASCYASDPYCRHILNQHGFFPVPQRDPIHFSLKIHPDRPDLTQFMESRRWYITMGDGDLELAS
jgi:hypothetical protein